MGHKAAGAPHPPASSGGARTGPGQSRPAPFNLFVILRNPKMAVRGRAMHSRVFLFDSNLGLKSLKTRRFHRKVRLRRFLEVVATGWARCSGHEQSRPPWGLSRNQAFSHPTGPPLSQLLGPSAALSHKEIGAQETGTLSPLSPSCLSSVPRCPPAVSLLSALKDGERPSAFTSSSVRSLGSGCGKAVLGWEGAQPCCQKSSESEVPAPQPEGHQGLSGKGASP